MRVSFAPVRNILTRTCGYLKTVTSHSLQPYRGCSFGKALCGVGCYVQHNPHVLRGREWGRFLEVRDGAARSYLENVERERRWARRDGGLFSIFLSSSTEPFVPQEFRYGVTRRVLEAMLREPPDALVLQTHSHRVVEYADIYTELASLCSLRIHLSIETDREELAGLPRHASSVAARLESARDLKNRGLFTVVTVSPLLPIADPDRFFARVACAADAVVIDHFIGGDGSPDGRRTRRTSLPEAMALIDPESVDLRYRERIVEVARIHLRGRVGVSVDGFAARWLEE